MSAQHTKGPWAIDAGFLVTKGYAGGVGVPMLELNGHCSQCNEPTGWITGKPEQWEADARLIAAAPELLAACQEIVRTGLLEEAMHGDQRAAVALCEAAISLATGESK